MTEAQRIEELEAEIKGLNAKIHVAEASGVQFYSITNGVGCSIPMSEELDDALGLIVALTQRAEAAERQVAELKRSFEQMGNEHQRMYHALREVITAVGGIAEEGVSIEFACFAPGEVRGRVAKLKREIGERQKDTERLLVALGNELHCATCAGTGEMSWSCPGCDESGYPQKSCGACHGTGTEGPYECAECDGEKLSARHGDSIALYRSFVEDAARSKGSTKGTAHSADAEGARNASDLGGDSREER